MTTITSSRPRFVLQGVDDQSAQQLIAQPKTYPQHLPLFYGQAPWGDDVAPILVTNGTDLKRIFGDDVLNPRSPYYNHVSVFVKGCLAQGNSLYFKRIVRPTSSTTDSQTGITTVVNPPKKANLVCFAEIDSITPLHPYARDLVTGKVILNVNGGLTFDTNSTITGGVKIKLSFAPQGALTDEQLASPRLATSITRAGSIANNAAVITGLSSVTGIKVGMPVHSSSTPAGTKVLSVDTTAGTVTLSANATAAGSNINFTFDGNIILALFKFTAPFYGAMGENFGVKLWKGNPSSINPADQDIITDQSALIYNAQIVRRASSTSSASAIPSLLSDTSIPFCWKPNAYNYKLNQNLTINRLVDDWSDDGFSSGTTPTYSPIGNVTVFDANLEQLLDQLLVAENANNPTTQYTTGWLLDFLSGTDRLGIHHYGFQMDTSGAVPSYTTSYFFQDGSDGDLSNATFEAAIINEIETNYNNPNAPLDNVLLYPFSAIYDSGFNFPVKNALAKWMNYRKNVHVTLGTAIAGKEPLTVSSEVSSAQSLQTQIATYNESDDFGTPAFRGTIMMQSGIVINEPNAGRLPMTYEIMCKRARWAGAGDGTLTLGQDYTIAPLNRIMFMKDISSPAMVEYAQDAAWNAGSNFAIPNSPNELFFASVQTVYPINNSVLCGDILQGILCNMELQSAIAWTQLVGRQNLTDSEFIKESNRVTNSLLEGKYTGSGITYDVETYYTPADSTRGYTWSQRINVYGNVPKTVGQMSIVVKRQS